MQTSSIVTFANEAGDMKYDVWLSIGYAEYGESGIVNQDQLISMADKRLYTIKNNRKMQGRADK